MDHQKRFELFHEKNPQVYEALVTMARKYRAMRPDQHIGMQTLYESLRWNYLISVNTEDDFKLNNNHCAHYSRLIMASNPDLDGLFAIRDTPFKLKMQ